MKTPLAEYNQFARRLPSEKSDICNLFIYRGDGNIACSKCSSSLITEMPYLGFTSHPGGICCECYIHDRISFFSGYLFWMNEIAIQYELCIDVVNYLKDWCRNFLIITERYYTTPCFTLENVLRWRLPLFWSDVFTIEFKNALFTISSEGKRLSYRFEREFETGNWKVFEKKIHLRGASHSWDHLKNFMGDMIENGGEKEFIISNSVVENMTTIPEIKRGSKFLHVTL